MNTNLFGLDLKDIRLPKKIPIWVVAVIMIILAIGVYLYVGQKIVPNIKAETAKLEQDNNNLQVEENDLTVLYDSMEFYLDEIDRLNLETETILEDFPTYMYLEDKLLFAQELEDDTTLSDYGLSGFGYGQSVYVTSTVYGQEEKPLELYKVAMSAVFMGASDKDLKSILEYGQNSEQRYVVNQIVASYDETVGYLSGTLSFTTYFIPGQTTPYEFPQEVLDKLGNSNRVDNLFGTR